MFFVNGVLKHDLVLHSFNNKENNFFLILLYTTY